MTISGVGSDNVVYTANIVGRSASWATATQKTKVCTRCNKRRKVEQFYKDKSVKDGLTSWCKSCTLDYDREYRARKKAEQA